MKINREHVTLRALKTSVLPNDYSILKYLIAILVFLSMMGQLFQGDFIILDYYTHQQKYTAMCINKDKPKMHCNGSCQLHKKLQQAQQHESNNPESAGGFKANVVLYCVIENLHFNWWEVPVETSFSPTTDDPVYSPDISDIFHPPLLPYVGKIAAFRFS